MIARAGGSAPEEQKRHKVRPAIKAQGRAEVHKGVSIRDDHVSEFRQAARDAHFDGQISGDYSPFPEATA